MIAQMTLSLFLATAFSAMALRILVVRKRGAAVHGRQASQVNIRAEGRLRLGRGRHGGMSRRDAMRELGVVSLALLDRWRRLYREGCALVERPSRKHVFRLGC